MTTADRYRRLTDPDTKLSKPTNVRSGEAAAQQGREFMIKEFGSEEALENFISKAGRPRVGETPRGASPQVRASISPADKALLSELSQRTGKKESELVREAVHSMLIQHKEAS